MDAEQLAELQRVIDFAEQIERQAAAAQHALDGCRYSWAQTDTTVRPVPVSTPCSVCGRPYRAALEAPHD